MESKAIHAEMQFREAPRGKTADNLVPAFAPSTSNPEIRNDPKINVDNNGIRAFSEQEIQDLEKLLQNNCRMVHRPNRKRKMFSVALDGYYQQCRATRKNLLLFE